MQMQINKSVNQVVKNKKVKFSNASITNCFVFVTKYALHSKCIDAIKELISIDRHNNTVSEGVLSYCVTQLCGSVKTY